MLLYVLVIIAYVISTVRSGTEEEYSELVQLLEDISTYQRDMQTAIVQQKEKKKQKEMSDKSIGEEMRKAAMESLSRKFVLTCTRNQF